MKFSKILHLTVVVTLSLLIRKNEASANEGEQCLVRRIRDNEHFYHIYGQIENRDSDMNDFGLSDRLNLSGLQIKSMDLDKNHFKDISSIGISILDLSINRIARIKMGAFEKFENLRILRMRMNKMSILNATTFAGLMMLEELDLSCNTISDISSATFRQLVNLRTIDLSENCIFHLPNYVFFRNVYLSHFIFSSNHLMGLPRLMMPSDQLIFKMNLSSNVFTNLSSLLHYTNIQSLDLSHNSLSPKEMNAMLSEMEADESSETSTSSENEDDDEHRNAHVMKNNKIYSNQNRNPHRRSKRNFSFPSASSSDSNYNSGENLMIKGREKETNSEELEKKKSDRVRTELLQKENHEKNSIKSMTTAVEDARADPVLVASTSPFFNVLLVRERNSIRKPRRTVEQWNRLMKATRINQMKFFTCKNCSLTSLVYLERFSELRYIDISSNSIRLVESALLRSFKNLETLLLTNNQIDTVDLTQILNAWPKLTTLALSNNPIKCSVATDVKYQADHLRKVFHLHLNVKKCK